MPRVFFFLVVLCLLLVGPLSAQSGSKEFAVETGQLNLDSVPKGNTAADLALGASGLKLRNAESTKAMVTEMSGGYRSACCPHQEMADPQCPCSRQQMYMLEFLVMQGYERHQVDSYMMNGGPKELTTTYQEWLVKEKGVAESYVTDFMRKRGPGPDGYWRLKGETGGGATDGPGWEKGWTTLIHEAPEGAFLYAMLAVLALLCVGTVVVGVRVLGKAKGTAETLNSEAPVSPEVSNDAAKRIERELAAMDDDA